MLVRLGVRLENLKKSDLQGFNRRFRIDFFFFQLYPNPTECIWYNLLDSYTACRTRLTSVTYIYSLHTLELTTSCHSLTAFVFFVLIIIIICKKWHGFLSLSYSSDLSFCSLLSLWEPPWETSCFTCWSLRMHVPSLPFFYHMWPSFYLILSWMSSASQQSLSSPSPNLNLQWCTLPWHHWWSFEGSFTAKKQPVQTVYTQSTNLWPAAFKTRQNWRSEWSGSVQNKWRLVYIL